MLIKGDHGLQAAAVNRFVVVVCSCAGWVVVVAFALEFARILLLKEK